MMQSLLWGILLMLGFHEIPDNDIPKIEINGLKISKGIIDSIQLATNKVFVPLKFYHWKDSIIDTTNYGHYDSTWHGIIIHNINETTAREIFNNYYQEITAEGNYLYLTNLHFDKSISHLPIDKPVKSIFDIAIVEAQNQFDVIERVGTQSLNYDISTKKIIDKLKLWDAEVAFKIVVVDYDRVEAIMLKKPKDLKKFCQEVYEFCPDVIDQGYGSMEAMLKDYNERNYLWLWWD